MIRIAFLFKVLRHFYPRVVISTSLVERFVARTTVQDGLVASDSDSHGLEGLHHLQTEALALMLLGHLLFDIKC